MPTTQPGRQRQNSAAASTRPIASHIRQKSVKSAARQSSHVSDPFLELFLNPSFDPAAYLNASLSPLQHGNATRSKSGKPSIPLSELSSEAQTLATQLNSHTTRLSNTLTQLTDDILRSGSRLAYEVELLRGETLGFGETLHETLRGDIEKFIPDGIQKDDDATEDRAPKPQPTSTTDEASKGDVASPDGSPNDPEFVKQLRVLTTVRSRLDTVIKTFGEAMDFVFPPSELSVSSSFLSVSAPEPGVEQRSSEEKGQQVLKALREEVSKLLADEEDPVRGIEEAARRVEELKELSVVWKGTAEEKGRAKFIESLAKAVEDAHKELLKKVDPGVRSAEGKGGAVDNDSSEPGVYAGGYGLISQLQRIRDGL
ncbi:uncharacterized protein DNG_06626 [Cephalotrichum gorgonifer]|uniref:Uncharacterized protein n=1 Tax=Cephalotrichum gorgonifer TaxID=2041049 RepID=A0AAE8SWQ8_9PEZI|nr:uncharacterized protein DNG_06626 [Cephalotrichum gorgonifer]